MGKRQAHSKLQPALIALRLNYLDNPCPSVLEELMPRDDEQSRMQQQSTSFGEQQRALPSAASLSRVQFGGHTVPRKGEGTLQPLEIRGSLR